MPERKVIIAGNWKMYKSIQEAEDFVKSLAPQVEHCSAEIYLAVPFTAIHACSKITSDSNIHIGAQNMHDVSEGAFTGEIASSMLINAGADFVILGHSERRHIFGEDNAFINRKVHRALEDEIQPILCCGETLEERNAGQRDSVLKTQIEESLKGLTKTQMKKLVIAYEPVWAIGTGVSATPDDAQETHAFLRELISELWSPTVGKNISILYGGSVKPANISSLIEQSDVDGVLVGGASLTVDTFNQLINHVSEEVNA